MKLISKWHHLYNNPNKHDKILSYEDKKNIIFKEFKKITNFKDKIVLDIGAGTGRQTFLYAKEAKKVYAIDPSKKHIQFLKNKIKRNRITNVEAKLAKTEKIPFKTNSVDIAVGTFSIASALIDKDKAIKEILKVLKPKGKIIIADSYYEGEFIDIWRKYSDKDIAGWVYNGFLRTKDMYNFKTKIINTSWDFPTIKKAVELFGYALGGKTKNYLIKNKKKKIKMKVFICYGAKNAKR